MVLAGALLGACRVVGTGEESATETGPQSTGPQRGGVVRLANADGTPADALDPARQHAVMEAVSVRSVQEPLVRLDENFNAIPLLAESWESNDARVWEFHLRDGIEFHDGSSLSARDVVYSLRRALEPALGTALGAQLGSRLKQENITAVDERVVRFELEEPDGFLPISLGNRYGVIYKEDTTDFSSPIGTGPFTFDSFTPGQSFRASANPNYWQDGQPYLDGIAITNVAEESARFEGLLSDQFDVIENLNHALAGDITDSDSHEVVTLKDGIWGYILCDLTVEPFTDPRVVNAFKLAVDRPQVVELVYAGFASAGYDNPIPSSDPFFNTALPAPNRDIQIAKELLAEAGYPNGIDLPFPLLVLDILETLGTVLKEQLAEAGINVELVIDPSATFWSDTWLSKPFYIGQWGRRHPSEIFPLVYASDGGWNISHIADERIDQAIQAAAGTTDPDIQRQNYNLIQEILFERDGAIGPAFFDIVHGKRRNLQGMINDHVSSFEFTEASFE